MSPNTLSSAIIEVVITPLGMMRAHFLSNNARLIESIVAISERIDLRFA